MSDKFRLRDVKRVVSSGKSSLAIVIPATFCKALFIEKGDFFHLHLTENGDILLRHDISANERKNREDDIDHTIPDIFD